MRVIGNETAQAELADWFPRVALLLGPPSVGKRTAAEAIIEEKGIDPRDRLFLPSMALTDARAAVQFSSSTPSVVGGTRAVVADIDNSTREALETLLAALESPHSTAMFWLVSSKTPLPTLQTRAITIRFQPLTDQQVSQVLQERRGFSRGKADKYASVSYGSVGRALRAARSFEDKNLVLLAVRALREKDPELLDDLALRWTEDHTSTLIVWATEAVTQRWALFNAAETGEVGNLPLKVLAATARRVRPRLVVRSQLMDLVTGA